MHLGLCDVWWGRPREPICMGVWRVVCYSMPWNWSLSGGPLPYVCALRTGVGCREAEAASTRCLLSLGQALVARWQREAEESVPLTTSTRAQHGFGIPEEWSERRATLEPWKIVSRARDSIFDMEAQGLKWTPGQWERGVRASLGQGASSKEPWEVAHGGWMHHSWGFIRQTSRNRRTS